MPSSDFPELVRLLSRGIHSTEREPMKDLSQSMKQVDFISQKTRRDEYLPADATGDQSSIIEPEFSKDMGQAFRRLFHDPPRSLPDTSKDTSDPHLENPGGKHESRLRHEGQSQTGASMAPRQTAKALESPQKVKQEMGMLVEETEEYKSLLRQYKAKEDDFKELQKATDADLRKQEADADEINELRTRIAKLEDRNAKLVKDHNSMSALVVGAQESALDSMLKKTGWSAMEDPVVQEEFRKLEDKLREWVKRQGIANLAGMEGIPATQKNKIVQQLDHYCSQSDWVSLMANMSIPPDRKPGVVLHALLAKDVFGYFFANPFFAFPEMEEHLLIPKPVEMQELYKTMLQLHREEAHIWRSQTLRILSTPADPATTSMLVERVRGVAQMRVANFLSSHARLLLRRPKNSEDNNKRVQGLEKLYYGAAEFATSLWTQRTVMELWDLESRPKFHMADHRMVAHRLHQLDEDENRLEGKDVILLVHPLILAFGNEDAENYDQSKLWARATVVVNEKS